jgi:hypothetical protein
MDVKLFVEHSRFIHEMSEVESTTVMNWMTSFFYVSAEWKEYRFAFKLLQYSRINDDAHHISFYACIEMKYSFERVISCFISSSNKLIG